MMDGDLAQAAEGALPGTAFHAPQVRLVTPEGQPVTVGGQPISPDIVSVKVILPASGVAQAEIVLNNQRHDDTHRPIVPTWRYNKLDELSFGSRVRIDMRYGTEGWTPMMLARITDLAFLFPSTAGAQVTLKGEDLASLLKVKPPEDMMHIDFHEVEIVQNELSEASSDLQLPSPAPQPLFSTPLESITRPKSKTYLQFITELAERMDYEVFVAFENEDPTADPTAAEARPVRFHFEPARSAELDDMITLHWGRDIIDFKPAFSVWDLPTEATARGNVPRERGSIEVTVSHSDALNDLHPAPGGTAPMNAVDARTAAFDDENRPEANSIDVPVSNIDEERARMAAIAKLRQGLRKFLNADITTIGFTRLRPGIHLNLAGFHPPFDGVYYVEQTVHTLNAAGYTTKSSLRRPGMLDPSGYPGVAA
jgi:hypothetical protein